MNLAAVEEALWAAAQALLPAGALDAAALDAAIHERTRRYTSERERLAAPLAGAARARDLAARALFFGVADAAKIAVPLAELGGRGLVPDRPLRVLDAGAGAGAMTLGLAAALPHQLAILAVDHDDEALAIAAHAARPLAPRVTVETRRADVTSFVPPGAFDLIVAGTLLNELPEAARAPLVRGWLDHLAPDGALVLIEPALRDTSRALHRLRDALLATASAHVFAPCTRAGAPCPALADESDWCHEDRRFGPPPRLARLAQRTGLRQGGLKFAYLTLRHAADPLVVPPAGRRALRVVSGALDQKGSVERFVCGDDGRTRLRVLTRAKGPSLRALKDSDRGDVLLIDGDDIERIDPTRS